MPVKPVSTQLKSRLSLVVVLLSILVIGVVYLYTMPVVNVGYGDSDEFLATAYNLGLAHPPGYPLYTILLYPFLHLPLPGATVAFKGHLFSLLLSLGTFMLMGLTSFRLLFTYLRSDARRFSSLSQKPLVPFIATLSGVFMVSFIPLIWLYATVTEKVAFSGFLVALACFSMFSWIQAPLKKKSLWFLASCTVTGLSISHHYTLLTLLLPLAYVSYLNRRWLLQKNRYQAGSIALIVSFLLPLLLLFPLNARLVPVSWHFPQTLTGWWQEISRASFNGDIYQQGQPTPGLADMLDINQGINALGQYALYLLLGVGWYLVILLLPMAQKLFQKTTPITTFLLVFSLSLGPLIAFLLKYPSDWGSQGILERQWYVGFIAFVPLFALAWLFFFNRLFQFLHALKAKPLFFNLVLFLPLPLLIYQGYQSFKISNRSHFTVISSRYQNMLQNFKPDSLVTCYSDVSCFALLYEQSVNHMRPDLDIVPLQYNLVTNTLNKPGIRGFTYTTQPYIMLDVVTWNMSKRPVYAVELNSYYYDLFGLDVPFMYFVPEGYYGQLTRTLPTALPTPPAYTLDQAWQQIPANHADPYLSFLKSTPARDHLLNGQMYLKMDQRDLALNEFNLAANSFFQFDVTEARQITSLRDQVEQIQPQPAFMLGSSVASADKLLSYIPDLLARNFRSRALQAAQGATIIDPLNLQARLLLADFYTKMGDVNFARTEYQNALRLDPRNASAEAALSQLSP